MFQYNLTFTGNYFSRHSHIDQLFSNYYLPMKFLISLTTILLFFLISNGNLKAQTCSCAGAPLLSSQSSGASSAGNLLFGFTYEYHDISDVYNGTTRLREETVSRSTQSTLFEISYGLTDRLSVSGTFSFVNKVRNTGLHLPGGGETVTANGIGDGVIHLRYIIVQQSLWNRYQFSVGGGIKTPFGSTSLTNNGFAMNADMQPGTGAWDGVLWANTAVSLLPFSTANLSLIASYRQTGTNSRFTDNDNYRFGNELILNLGVGNRLFTDKLSYQLSARYRSTSSDQLNGVTQVNTGGNWFSLIPAINYRLSEKITTSLSVRIPIQHNLSGTQPTTSYAISGSIFFNFNSNKNNGFQYGTPK